MQPFNNSSFNESEWIKLIFLLSDTQEWINNMEKQMFYQLPITETSKLFKKTFYLTASAMAHIIERHYDKTRHPSSGKFTITVAQIADLLRQSSQATPVHLTGTLNYIRSIDTQTTIGFDKYSQPTSTISVITDPSGKILTAFPGQYEAGLKSSEEINNQTNCSI